MPRILVVSYDKALLQTRQMLLETEGYEVVAALGYDESLRQCEQGGFDLFILGHSIPETDKRKLVNTFRHECPAPIVSLLRTSNETPIKGADYHIVPDPVAVINVVNGVLKQRQAPR